MAQKFVIRDYDPLPAWTIEPVPPETGFDEELTTLILGSRRPILFVEGTESSLDLAIYRCCYSEWTVVPRGSYEEVIHSVVTMRRNESLTRVTCSGIVDADAYNSDDANYLASLKVSILSVSEIENIVLLPQISRAIAEIEGYIGSDLEGRLSALQNAIFASLNSKKAIDDVVVRYCRRRIDRILKKIDFSSAETVEEISTEYKQKAIALDIDEIAGSARKRIIDAITEKNLPALLANYDNKGLMALAATHLKASKKDAFEGWLLRTLKSEKQPALIAAIRSHLPVLKPE